MFDLGADPAVLRSAMRADSTLGKLWEQNPGLRVARAFSGYESMIGTILRQLVSVKFGRILNKELMQCAGSPARHPDTDGELLLFPSTEQILGADLSNVRTSPMRRMSLRLFAQRFAENPAYWMSPAPGPELKRSCARSRVSDLGRRSTWPCAALTTTMPFPRVTTVKSGAQAPSGHRP